MFPASRKLPVRRTDNLPAICEPIVRLSKQCETLNISQPLRPPRSLTGIALFFFSLFQLNSFVRLNFGIQTDQMSYTSFLALNILTNSRRIVRIRSMYSYTQILKQIRLINKHFEPLYSTSVDISTFYELQPLSIKFRDWVCKETHLEHVFPEFPNIYLGRVLKSVSELYGQRLYIYRSANCKE
jgi:hypothetical protein